MDANQLAGLSGVYEKLVRCHPKLERGMVWCRTCGKSQKADSAECLRSGWPKCCDYTMTIDAPTGQGMSDDR